MIATDAIRALIRDGRTHLIPSTIETSSKYDMVSMDRSLVNLFKQGLITKEVLFRNCIKPEYVKGLLQNSEVMNSSSSN